MAQPPPLAEVSMYSECTSLTESLQERSPPSIVLSSYPPAVGREVVRSVLPPLKGSSRPSPAGRETGSGEGEEQSPLQTREEVEWTMEVLGHGLQLPLTDHDLVSSCIAVYEDWLSAFSSSPSPTVPAPVVTDPNHYCLVILTHLYQLFTPREADSGSQLELHLQLCQRVLTLTKSLVMTSGEKLSEPTCEAVCRHLLSVADLLLSPPLDPFSLAARLSGQLTHVLFAAWLRACTAFFPGPHMWKSLRELCLRWRHHLCLATEWSSLMYSLTLRVVSLLYSPSYLAHLQDNLQEDSEFSEILHSIPPDSLVQAWFRLLHTLGNPVDLSSLSSLPLFQKVAGDHLSAPALDVPHIFYEALQGVARLVYLFLGLEPRHDMPRPPSEGSASLPPLSARPSPQGLRRKGSKEFRDKSSVSGSIGGGGGAKKSTIWYDVTSPRLPIVPQLTPLTSPLSSDVKRPRGNTILHLFGSWLFEAVSRPALHGGERGRQTDSARPAVFRSLVDLNGSTDSTLTLTTPPEYHAQFEAGRAEAIGALCAIFSSQPCGEPFLQVYLARFYRCLHLGLQHDEASQGLVMTRILLNSPSLFRKGLPGLNLILPSFLTALDLVLPHPAPLVRCSVGTQELRHASIQILLSVFSLPLHFLQQPLPAMSVEDEEEEREKESVTFYSLREWTLWLLFSAIEHEKGGSNLQLLLHGVLVCLQDTVLYENVTTRLAEEGVGEGEGGSARTEFFSSVDKDYGSASLFRRACKAAHWCLLQWQNKIHVSLSALELLQGLAQLQFEYIDHEDLKMAVMWVCEYIHRRAEKDKILHSKDLHTSIVAAFSCLLSWVTLHPYLLGDKTILEAVMQVVELGISGTLSQSPSGSTVYKGEKELKPISGRVKEIAEFVLTAIMEQVGAFPLPCGAESTSSLLNEEHLLARLPVTGTQTRADSQFRYFLVDNSIVLGLLEAEFTADAAPSVTAVVRGLSGRHCWNMQLRMRPRSSQDVGLQGGSMPRPVPTSPPLLSPSSFHRSPWPEEACDGPELELNSSIPSLQSVLDAAGREEYEEMAQQLSRETELETSGRGDLLLTPCPPLHPPVRTEVSMSTGRLLLNHLGLLGMEVIQPLHAGQKQSVGMLDHSNPSFKQSLGGLDRLSTRFCNTVFILYCRQGCHRPEDILAQQAGSVGARPPEFLEFLQGLGWSVDDLSHTGFSGKIRPERPDETGHLLQFAAQIPQQQPFHYFADSMTEMAFVQPILRPSASHSSASLRSVESSDSGQDAVSLMSKSSLPPPAPSAAAGVERELLSSQTSLPFLPHANQAAAEGERFHTLPTRGKLTSGSRTDIHSISDPPRKKTAVPQDCAAMVVWLERFEDHASFPLESLSAVLHGASFSGGSRLSHQRRVLPCIFIHMLPSGLYQVTTTAPRMESLAGPLMEGMVVSRRSLSHLARLTAANMCGRHRLDNEGYCPPHVKRKRKIEEMAAAFSLQTSVPEFYSRLLFPDRTVP